MRLRLFYAQTCCLCRRRAGVLQGRSTVELYNEFIHHIILRRTSTPCSCSLMLKIEELIGAHVLHTLYLCNICPHTYYQYIIMFIMFIYYAHICLACWVVITLYGFVYILIYTTIAALWLVARKVNKTWWSDGQRLRASRYWRIIHIIIKYKKIYMQKAQIKYNINK